MSWDSLQVVRDYTHTPFVVDLDWIGSHFVQRAGFAHSALQVPAASKIMGLAWIGLLHGICMDMEWEDVPRWRTNLFVFIFVLLIQLRHGISDVITKLWTSGAFSTLHLHVLSCSAVGLCGCLLQWWHVTCNQGQNWTARDSSNFSIEVHTYLAPRSSYLWQTF